MNCAEVRWIEKKDGSLVPKEDNSSEFSIDADLILLAMGFTNPGNGQLLDNLGVELNERGFVKRDADNKTSISSIYTAGDIASGPSLVVRAIQDGKQTAVRILRFLLP